MVNPKLDKGGARQLWNTRSSGTAILGLWSSDENLLLTIDWLTVFLYNIPFEENIQRISAALPRKKVISMVWCVKFDSWNRIVTLCSHIQKIYWKKFPE